MENRKKIIEKAKKLKALADRGVGGEQINAKEMFDKYVKHHNITEEELNEINSNYTEYAYMSDEDFLNEMAKELIPIGIGYVITHLFKKQNEYTDSAFKNVTRKYISAMEERLKVRAGKK